MFQWLIYTMNNVCLQSTASLVSMAATDTKNRKGTHDNTFLGLSAKTGKKHQKKYQNGKHEIEPL